MTKVSVMTMPANVPAQGSRSDIASHLAAMRHIRTWTRERFALAPQATVLVEQEASALPGFPPVETTVAFWTTPETRHEFKVFKPAVDIDENDLPPSWMKGALEVEIALGCTCC